MRTHFFSIFKVSALLVIVVAVLGTGGYLGLNYLANTRLGIRSSISAVTNLINASLARGEVAKDGQGNYTNIIFLHHSVGMNLITQGGLREQFNQAGYQFWDQGYNTNEGLRNPEGKRLSYVYYVPHDNTDPDGMAIIFGQPVFALPVNTLSGLLQHDVIIFKSCFPASQITSDEELAQVKQWYLDMRQTFDRYPNKLFIAVTQPPLNPAETDAEAAQRARALAEWLQSEEYLGDRKNLTTFDLFGLLAESDPAAIDYNRLRADYRQGDDSHPIRSANETIAPQMANFVIQAIEEYRIKY